MKLIITISGDKSEVVREVAAIKNYAETSRNNVEIDVEEAWEE